MSALYIGETSDVVARVRKHQAGEASGFTRTRLPVVLVYAEQHPDSLRALARERQLKRWTRVKKEALIAGNLVLLKPHPPRSVRDYSSRRPAKGSVSAAVMSPDARWIAFRVGQRGGLAPRMAVVPAAGGEAHAWTFVTSGREAADKPCWSDDGATLYFTSGSESMTVWGIRLHTLQGRPVGHPFQVTRFRGPGEHILSDVRPMEMSTGGRRLVVPLVRPKGGLWMLELGAR